jgi:L-iditol 2-dehydrogenase
MKSACITGIRNVELKDIPEPTLGDDDILVKVKSCGVCGSDVHYYRDGRIGDAVCRYPHFVGHEPAGIIEKAPEKSQFKAGDRVAIEPGLPCGECEFCLSGRFNICPKVKFLGSPGIAAAFQEYLALKESQLEKIPDSVSYDEAAMLEPLGIAYHAVVTLAQLKPGETVAVFGAGPIGLLTLAMAKIRGCGTAFITDPLKYRLDFASEFCDADFIASPGDTDVLDFIMEKTRGRGVDVTFDAAGCEQSINHTFDAAAIGGRAMLIGIPEVDTISYNPHRMRRKELSIINVRRSNLALEPCLELVTSGKIDLKPFITHHFSLEEIQTAFYLVDHYQDGVIRAMVNPA